MSWKHLKPRHKFKSTSNMQTWVNFSLKNRPGYICSLITYYLICLSKPQINTDVPPPFLINNFESLCGCSQVLQGLSQAFRILSLRIAHLVRTNQSNIWNKSIQMPNIYIILMPTNQHMREVVIPSHIRLLSSHYEATQIHTSFIHIQNCVCMCIAHLKVWVPWPWGPTTKVANFGSVRLKFSKNFGSVPTPFTEPK